MIWFWIELLGLFVFFLRLHQWPFFFVSWYFFGRLVIVGSLGVTAFFLWCFCNGKHCLNLVVWNIFMNFQKIGNVIIPSDSIIFQRGRSTGRSTTSNGNRLSPESWQYDPRCPFWGLRGGSAVQEPLTTYGVHNVIWPMGWWILMASGSPIFCRCRTPMASLSEHDLHSWWVFHALV